MYTYRLECECGYVSNPSPYGQDMWSPNYYVPVVVDGDDKLQTLQIVMLEDETDKEFL